MIVTVTPNPALDLTWHVEKIVPGGTHRADAGAVRAGGKGLNVARVAHAAGADVIAVTTAGGATGEEFRAELTAAGVPAVLVPVVAATRRSIALVDEALGDTTIVNERGIAPTDAEWQALRDAVAGALSSAARPGRASRRSDASKPTASATGAGQTPPVLAISGSVPPGTPDDLLPSLIALGREAGAIVVADTSGPALLRAADAGADVLKPNAAELAEATGIADPIEGARELLRRGASLILLSRGAEGMLAVSADSAGAVGNHGSSGPVSEGQVAPRRDEELSSVASDAFAESSVAAVAPVDDHGSSGLVPEGRSAARRGQGVSSVASDSLEVISARLPDALAGNPTGAGDAAVSAAAVLLAEGIRDPEAILRRATAWSAAAVLMPLAGDIHPSWPDLEAAVIITRETSLPAREPVADATSGAQTEVSPEAKDTV
ncbi:MULTISPECIES: 1-phosphofructokinase family hexose kinase [unclassified Microbacterium]|uniref:1-phosphofructokinase family hexose kinase n=1 Tax=unclassified Microbacterium TaxID=2609290 RepID=UPI0012F7518A|nr:PfkB family carbohydrate kinase [Microbacterium sp. MAH-37]